VTVNPQSENKVYITFNKGILKTAFAENTTSPAKFEIEYKAYDFSISDYEKRKQLNYIVGYENGTKSVTEYAEIKRR
ncbi:MAG: hypothetical protein Q3993_08780, partial [Filifactor alocis]|nr:hypothetical protein [Filifactor alocis]